jgi:hypothetical protein
MDEGAKIQFFLVYRRPPSFASRAIPAVLKSGGADSRFWIVFS